MRLWGTRILLPVDSTDSFRCNPDYSIPVDFHEFEIAVLNLQDINTRVYRTSEHRMPYSASSVSGQYRCIYPQRIFDSVPLAASGILYELKNSTNSAQLIIVFAGTETTCDYEYETIKNKSDKQILKYSYSSYDFLEFNIIRDNRSGNEIEAVKNTPLYEFLRRYTSKAKYEITFKKSTGYDPRKTSVTDDMFIPLMRNSHLETISFILKGPKYSILVFPSFQDKAGFMEELFWNELPTSYPKLFPFNSLFAWLLDKRYYLPKEAELVEKRAVIEEKYQNDMKAVRKQIEDNKESYVWLHDILTESGSKLVEAVEYFLKWLGFADVRVMDLVAEKKEEDIQVDFSDGLLVIEVKGISGTSTDSDCEQITKIRHRRAEERGAFDVYGLYIVNHQRFQPPHVRKNPPFTEDQIKDAKSDKRGLLTTWQLYNLYFDIENGFVSKDEARNALEKVGLIEFTPSNSHRLGKPKEMHYDGTVVIIEIDNKIMPGNKILIKRDRISSLNVVELRVDDETVEEVQSGEVGIKLDGKVNATDDLYLAF